MNAATVIILILIALAVIFSIRYALRHPNPCDTCSGNDPSCTLDVCGKTPEERKNFYRDKKLSDLWDETTGENR